MKSKIKSHGDEDTCIYDNEIPRVNSSNTCLAVNSLDSALKSVNTFKQRLLDILLMT